MKLTAKIRLLPKPQQEKLLFATLEEANAACNAISEWTWNNKTFRQYKIHHGTYHTVKVGFHLSAQMIVRCISKVADGYKLDKQGQRIFKLHGSIAYDSRILSLNFNKCIASIWTVGGRQKISYVTGAHHAKLLQYQQGESDLCYIRGKWYLHTTCNVPDKEEYLFEDVLGVDLGIINIATDSDGKSYEGSGLNELREKREKTRNSLQRRGTRGAKKVLKRISGREKTTTKIINHTISKALVAKAKREQKAIAIEDLKAIRERTNQQLRKSQRGLHNRWSFYQLRQFISYKAQRECVPIILIPPAYTSQTCSCCHYIGRRNGEVFKCRYCGYCEHADVNAAKNIRSWGRIVNRPEESALLSCDLHTSVSDLNLPLLLG